MQLESTFTSQSISTTGQESIKITKKPVFLIRYCNFRINDATMVQLRNRRIIFWQYSLLKG
ncbi:hypothetical protein D8M05_03945 [Oceanobacillus bengalensis]|uniref:Uncharacterized protein n=1 Tax=Oceanobacillus bengalensis TaxID=1435466 RepID=A0A494Z4S2_9BACI|nr:hypothetical protein D8M05_03945 [Oceanobacillus bengalensis]